MSWQGAFDRHYANAETGGYYLTADDAEGLVVRPASTSDDATPNPNAVAAHNLVRLAMLTGDDTWRTKADRLFEGVLAGAASNLFSHAALLNALDLRLNAVEIVVTGPDHQRFADGRAEAAVPQPDRAARGLGRGPAGVASGTGQDCGGSGKRGVRLRRRAVFAAGHRSGRDRSDSRGDAAAGCVRIRRPASQPRGSIVIRAEGNIAHDQGDDHE